MPPAARRTPERLGLLMIPVVVVDVLVMYAVTRLAWAMRTSIDNIVDNPFVDPRQAQVTVLSIVLWIAVLTLAGAYHARGLGMGFDELRAIAVGSMTTLFIVATIAFLTQSNISRGFVLLTFTIGAAALMAVRYADRKALHALRRRGHFVTRVIAVGSGAAVAELAGVIAREPWTGYRLIGMCTSGPAADETGEPPVPVLGPVSQVREIAQRSHADAVLVGGGTMASSAHLRRLGWDIEGLDLDLLVVPSLTDVAGPRMHFRHVAGLPLVHVREPQIARASGWLKRLFDVVAAGALLVVLAVPMLLIALAIRMHDGGPALFRQRRVGLDRREFGMVKFRSMVVGADEMRVDMTGQNEFDNVLFKIKDDPRITPLGRFMRRFSIDELPQLFNVLRGDMSLVGPRPPLPDEVAAYEEHVHRRLLVRPGMTGLWQVSGRSDLSWEESVRLDLYYVDNWSLVSDLVILLKTIRAVLVSQGAY